MDRATATPKTLVLGIGNSLLTDDGVGIHVIEALVPEASGHLIIRDGGTIGLALLPEIEDADQLIAVDAMELGGMAGHCPGLHRGRHGPCPFRREAQCP